jgi:hypothetical protein
MPLVADPMVWTWKATLHFAVGGFLASPPSHTVADLRGYLLTVRDGKEIKAAFQREPVQLIRIQSRPKYPDPSCWSIVVPRLSKVLLGRIRLTSLHDF